MESGRHQQYHKSLTFRRSLKALRSSLEQNSSIETAVVKEHLWGFVDHLQRKYPFTFAIAYRNLKSERNKQVQERLTTHFLLGAISELADMDAERKELVWNLGALLCRHVGKGGENFRPHQFTASEQKLAEEIGEAQFDLLIHKAEELSMSMKFRMGPVNTIEHVISWSFLYAAQLLKAARWESTQAQRQADNLHSLEQNSPSSGSVEIVPLPCEIKNKNCAEAKVESKVA